MANLEKDIENLVESYSKSGDSKDLSDLYFKLDNLSYIFIKEMYPDFDEYDCQTIAHDIASSIIINKVIKNKTIETWHLYLKRVVRNQCSDYLRETILKRNVFDNDEDITIIPDSNIHKSFSTTDFVFSVGQSCEKTYERVDKILTSSKYLGIKNNLFKKQVLDHCSGKHSITNHLPKPMSRKIKLFSSLISKELNKTRNLVMDS